MSRSEVYLVSLDPTVGHEMRKTRPCVVVSPDEMNQNLRTVIVAPMTTNGRPYPSRVKCRFGGKSGLVALDQMRALDQTRLVKRLGRLSPPTMQAISTTLLEMFAP